MIGIVCPDNDTHHLHMGRVMVILGHTTMIHTDIILENNNALNLLNIALDLLDVALALFSVVHNFLPIILNLHTHDIGMMLTIIMNLDLVGQGISFILKIQMKDSKVILSMVVMAPRLILSPHMTPTLPMIFPLPTILPLVPLFLLCIV
jgi:hypothetical protein